MQLIYDIFLELILLLCPHGTLHKRLLVAVIYLTSLPLAMNSWKSHCAKLLFRALIPTMDPDLE
jgi:hypothetical protein